jgi:hypothetical protein
MLERVGPIKVTNSEFKIFARPIQFVPHTKNIDTNAFLSPSFILCTDL